MSQGVRVIRVSKDIAYVTEGQHKGHFCKHSGVRLEPIRKATSREVSKIMLTIANSTRR